MPLEVSPDLWGVVAIGLAVGYLAGMFGVGGGFIANPLLNCALNVPMRIVAGSTLCQVSGTSLAGLLRHRRHGQLDARIAAIVIGGVLCGEVAGVGLLEWLEGLGTVTLAGGSFKASEVVLKAALLLMLLVIGVFVFLEARAAELSVRRGASGHPRGWLARVKLPPYVVPAGGEPVPVLLLAYLGVPIGLAQGLLGIGGGVLLLPALVYVVGVATHAAVGTDLAIVFVGAIAGTFIQALEGNVSLPLVAALMVPATFGSQLGALTTTRLPAHRLRRYFSLVVAAAALLVAWKLAGMLGLLPGR